MIRKIWIPLSSIAFVVSLLMFCSSKKSSIGDSLLNRVVQILDQKHYAPAQLDDAFSKKVYKNVLEKLDNDHKFFTQTDIAKLNKYETHLDDQIKAGKFDFFDTAWTIMMQRINQIENYYSNILDKPFDFNTDEKYLVKEEETAYYADEAAQKEDWRKWLKFQTLDKVYRKLEQQKGNKADSGSEITGKNLTFDSIEIKARGETRKFCADWFKRWRKLNRKEQISFYVNCITEVYDPHTNFFPPEEKANFDISMTGKLEGIGATLSERDGQVKVERIVPGSASYRQGELKAGDIILKVAQGAGEAVNIVDMKLDDAIQLIRGKKGTEVRLTVKKPDGKIVIIPIIREVVVIEETYARSAIIKNGKSKIGIINLPSFYADFSESGRGRHCSEDVKIEINKLKNAGAKGIILDLRNNGGGSLQDVIEMGSLFVGGNPMVMIKQGSGKEETLKDKYGKEIYSGPLVLLTNTYSASASEILAAAMQDYKRAVVIGTKSTFGKGTVQTFFDMAGPGDEIFKKGFGQLKVTIQKFYRINGGTTQLMGVVPDIIVPDVYDGIEQGEKEMRFHMEYDKITPASYEVYSNKSMSRREKAIVKGIVRVLKSDHYARVTQRGKEVESMRKSFEYSLNLKEYSEQQAKLKEQEKNFTKEVYKQVFSEVEPLEIDLEEVKGNEIKTIQRKDWLKIYSKDAMLDQAVFVMEDLF